MADGAKNLNPKPRAEKYTCASHSPLASYAHARPVIHRSYFLGVVLQYKVFKHPQGIGETITGYLATVELRAF